jgi:hypothetical protein
MTYPAAGFALDIARFAAIAELYLSHDFAAGSKAIFLQNIAAESTVHT